MIILSDIQWNLTEFSTFSDLHVHDEFTSLYNYKASFVAVKLAR